MRILFTKDVFDHLWTNRAIDGMKQRHRKHILLNKMVHDIQQHYYFSSSRHYRSKVVVKEIDKSTKRLNAPKVYLFSKTGPKG